jgi:hypothetical protein
MNQENRPRKDELYPRVVRVPEIEYFDCDPRKCFESILGHLAGDGCASELTTLAQGERDLNIWAMTKSRRRLKMASYSQPKIILQHFVCSLHNLLVRFSARNCACDRSM